MARKDLLKGLMGLPDTPPATPGPAAPTPPRPVKGAIGAVSQSIQEMRARSVIDVPSDMIDHAGLHDRLDEDPEGIAALAASMRDYGQQVPVLLRHSPNHEGRYEVVYGRRRVAALKSLGQPVKAMIRNLTDRELIVAQGQENTARRDLSFIEKVMFAAAMREEGFERRVICDALMVDKTLISRMLAIADAVPVAVVRAIGAAPGIGRDRWMKLAEGLRDCTTTEALRAAEALAEGPDSDARFEAVLAGLTAPAAPARPRPAPRGAAKGEGSARWGGVSRNTRETRIRIDRSSAAGFDDWLLGRIDSLFAEWQAGRTDAED